MHICVTLNTLRHHKLFCKPVKCHFGSSIIISLGHEVSRPSISPDSQKLKAVHDWPVPTSVHDVREFLGFVNYFRRFIANYATIAKSLDEITGKNARFIWTAARQTAFKQLKNVLQQAYVLRLANVSQPFRVDTDAVSSRVSSSQLCVMNYTSELPRHMKFSHEDLR